MTIEKMLRLVVLSGIFALPFIVFIVSTSLFFPFITGKNFTFRIIVEIIAGAYLALALLDPAYRPKRSWLLGAFALFVVIVALADIFGTYPFKSFWSNFERMDGWVTLAHLFLYFVVLFGTLNTEKLWRRFWQVSLAVSALVAGYGLLQVVGVASLNPGFSSAARIDATLGNPIYLAVYMLFHIGIGALLWARSFEENGQEKRVSFSLLYGASILFSTLILFMTGTRGAMLGLIGGLFLAALLAGLTSVEWRRFALVALALLLVLAGGFFLVREQAWVRSIPYIERLATISFSDATIQARFMNWGIAWEGVKERPILGWGQENYALVFDKYYNPKMYAQEQWFDRVHNIIFDWLVAAGFLGLLSYLSIIGTALWLLWRRASSAFSNAERIILTALIAAYFACNLTVFDNITSYMLFTSILAYIAWHGSADAQTLPLPTISRSMLPAAAFCAVILVWGSAWYVNARAISANRALLQALQPQENGLMENLEQFKKAISYGTIGVQEVREQLVQGAIQVAGVEGMDAGVRKSFHDTAVSEMRLMMEESPQTVRFPFFLAILHRAYGEHEASRELLEKAHELSPGKQTILFELAANAYTRGDTERALEIYRDAYELAPEFIDARIFYAALAIRMGRDQLADELLAPLLASGDAADPRIASAYVSRRRYDKIAAVWEARVAAKPDDLEAYFTLAAAYYGAGNSQRAIGILEEAGRIAPGAKAQADALKEQIRAGTVQLQ